MHGQSTSRRTPALAWLLAFGAVLDLALWAWVNWYRVFGPYLILRIEDMTSIITGAGPFLLGAAVLFGAGRWAAAGRPWFVAGAVVAGLHGLAQLSFSAWWAWSMSMDTVSPEGVWPVVSVILGLISAVAAALVPLCLAIGLARAPSRRRLSVPLLVVPLLVAAAAVSGFVGMLTAELALSTRIDAAQQGAYAVLGVAHRVMSIAGDVGFAALAIAALRAMPRPIAMPELLIAAGALLVGGSRAASSISQAILSIETQSETAFWVFTVPFAIGAAGYVLLIVGFGLAAIVAGPGRAELEPRHSGSMGTLAG
jgi:hypothetical protein